MKIFKKPIFYITFLITFFVGLRVLGWDFLGIWTLHNSKYISENYIKSDVVDDISIQIVFLAIDLVQGKYYQYQILKDSVSVLKESNILIKLNVLNLLKDSSNRQVTLETLLIRLDHSISKIENLSSQILAKINEYNNLYDQCLSEKNLGDNQFFLGIKNFDYEILINGLNQSVHGGSCAEKNRIYSRGYQKIYDLLQKHKYLLQTKYNILANNQDLILQNIYLFEGNYLEKLLSLKKQLTMINGY